MHRSDPIVIVGTGFAGIGMAVRLLQAGHRDVTLLEAADRLGGTWRENTYPGAACDVPSLLYSFSFAPHAWSRMFAPQEEILAYLERCVDELGVRPHIRFRCGVTRAVFDERDGMWTISTPDGELRARVLISATGAITRPALPEIPGMERFRGRVFHSARWDHGRSLDGERVAVIGTGASAIQIVPAIAPRVRRLSVFQRTPTWILPKPDAPFTERQLALFRRAPFVQTLARGAVYSIMESLALGFVVDPRLMVPQATRARAYLREAVPDPALRARLTPDYVIGCKRILFSSDYYPAIQRDDVDLVTEPIEAITEEGVRTRDGRVTSIDTLVLATGFHAADFSCPYTLVGRGGRSLDEAWSGGAEAYLGTTVSGFPNLFLLFGPNTALGHSSMIYMFESQIAYVMDALSSMTRHGTRTIEVRRDVQDRFNAAVQARLARSVWASGCGSWYRTRTGKNTTLWPGFTFEYRYRTRRFDVESYLLTGGRPAPTPSMRLGLAAPLPEDRQRRDGAPDAPRSRGVSIEKARGAAIADSVAMRLRDVVSRELAGRPSRLRRCVRVVRHDLFVLVSGISGLLYPAALSGCSGGGDDVAAQVPAGASGEGGAAGAGGQGVAGAGASGGSSAGAAGAGGSGGASCPAHTHPASGGCDATLGVVDPGGGFAKARDHHATFLTETPAGAFLFVAGGTNYTSIFSDVQRAPIAADGSVGAFTAAGSLPGQNAGMCAVVGKGRVVLAGGRTGSGFRADVWSAPIAGDGSLGAFTAGAPLPEGRFHVGCALSGTHVYATGGLESAKNEATTSVFRFDLTADGTGAPVALAPLPKPVSHHATLVQGDFLYVFGGLAGNPAGVTKKQVDVLRAKIQPDGDLGAWETIATMPAWLGTHAACSFDGRAYLFGGVLDNATVSDAIFRAPFLPDGGVGPWEQLAKGLPQKRSHMHHAPVRDGRVYLAGGSFFEPPSSTHQIQSTVFVGTFE